jgi:hypothetical protein
MACLLHEQIKIGVVLLVYGTQMIAFCAGCWPIRGVEHRNCDIKTDGSDHSDTFRADLSVRQVMVLWAASVSEHRRLVGGGGAVEREKWGFCVREFQIDNLLHCSCIVVVKRRFPQISQKYRRPLQNSSCRNCDVKQGAH